MLDHSRIASVSVIPFVPSYPCFAVSLPSPAIAVGHNFSAIASIALIPSEFPAALLPFCAGVMLVAAGHNVISQAAPARVSPCPLPWLGAFFVVLFSFSDALAAGHNKHPLAALASVRFSRAE